MEVNQANSRAALAGYEADLTARITTVTLIGQVGYDAADLAALRAALRPLFAASAAVGLADAGARYPLTFALYLVLEALYHYEGGDYWTAPCATLNLTAPAHTADAGRLFRRVARGAGLPTFEHLGGHVHVTPILAHAGIPNYCLADFFALLDRAARRAAAVDAATLLDEWADGRFPIAIDRPVQRFLLHGGDIAEEFVGRCLELWRDDDPDPASLDLPARVLEAYENWRAQRGPRPAARAARLGRPKLIYDPYGEGVAILLPPVTYAAAHAPEELTWQIVAGDRQRTEPATRRRLGDDVAFTPRAAAVNVLSVAPAYTVTALADGAPLQAWTLVGPAAPPLLAFDAATGELLVDRQRENETEYWLTPGERRLIFPRGWSAAPQGAHKLAELPQGEGEWADFAAETWQIEPDGRLELSAPDGARAAFRARNDQPPARPFLDGPPLLPAGAGERFALYNGRPPDLIIPPGRAAHQPEKWRVTITPAGAADPPAPRAWSLADLAAHWAIVDGNLLLALDAPELLGPAPLGEFHIALRGPYGRRAEFDVRFAPGLRFVGYPRFSLLTGDAPTQFEIVHPAGYALHAAQPGVTLGLAAPAPPTGVSRALTAAPEIERVTLRLEREGGISGSDPASPPSLTFDLPLYRLRIGLVEPERPDAFHWATSPLRLHPEALDAPHSALLRVDLPRPPAMAPVSVGWRLVAADGGPLGKEIVPRPATRYPQTGLGEWLDTFRHAGRAATLQLVVVEAETGQATAVDVARLLPTLELGEVITAWSVAHGDSADAGDHLSIVWAGDAAARGRQLRLWPVDRPWAVAPFALAVADDAADCAEWALSPGQLPPGEYLAEMVVVDPWDISPPARPAPGATNTFPLRPDDMDAAREAALARARRDELPAEEALAWLLYLARRGAGELIARFSVTLWRERAGLTLAQCLLWADAARAFDDDSAYRLAQKALFENGRLAALGELAADQRRAYLAHLPGDLDTAAYRALLPVADGAAWELCLGALCRAGDEAGLMALLDAVAQGTMTRPAALKLLLPAARRAADFLFADGRPAAIDLLRALLRQKPDDRFIAEGTELQTNAGYMQVTGIRDSQTQALVSVCRHNGDAYTLLGKLWPATSKLSVQINLQEHTINILRGPIYRCQFTGQPACDYVYNSADELLRHHRHKHRMEQSVGASLKTLTLALTELKILPPDGF